MERWCIALSGRFKLIAALCLAAALLLGLCGMGLAEESTSAVPPEYKLAAQSSRFNLYVREDTLAIILESKLNGSLLYSTVQNPDDFKD